MSYADFLTGLLRGPLAGTWGTRFLRAVGGALDAAADAALDAGLLRGPADAQDDALPLYAGARGGIAQLAGESLDTYRARLVAAWETWSWACTAYGTAETVGLLGGGIPAVWSYRELPVDADASRWARLSVVFRGLPAWDGAATWDGDDVWDSPRRVDPVETADPLTFRPRLRRALRESVGARDVVDRVVVAFGSLLWDVDAVWDGDDVWDAGDGEAVWQSPEWDSAEAGAVWDGPEMAWDAFC